MDLITLHSPPTLQIPTFPLQHRQNPRILDPFRLLPRPRRSHCRKRAVFRARASQGGDGSGRFSWESVSLSFRRGSKRFFDGLAQHFEKETGVDLESVGGKVEEVADEVRGVGRRGGEMLGWCRMVLVPRVLDWNKWERWKDVKKWDSKRVGVLILYTCIVILSSRRIYFALTVPRLDRQSKTELREAYMEAVIPEPSSNNIRKVKKSIWRKTMPKGLKIKKFVEGPDGTLLHDNTYVGEDAWDDDPEPSIKISNIIDNEARLDKEQKDELKASLGITGQIVESGRTWRERLAIWRQIMQKEKSAEERDSLNAKYVVDFDMQEVEKSLHKEVTEKVIDSQGSRALWISKRWWRYRPKLPYSYFLHKLDCSEVAAVMFTEDLKKVYVTMKEGFPLEYIVDIPLDPYLFEIISSSGVEVDLLQKKQIHYFLKVVAALAPGLLILWFIRESVMLLHVTSSRFLYKKYNQLFDMANAENFILPIGGAEETKAMYKEVVLGGDVWDLLDELMIYMRNPMQYYEKEVTFARGVLLSGPPGTGKTLFARTLAKESGLPFVFASGAEFSDSERSGAARINELFSMARRNAPSFVFVDEIDAIAGRHAKKDPRRRATFNALLSQLDGKREKTGVDRFSLRQAVIFICATNRPDELDYDFVLPGRIDRRLYVGLPDAKQRVQIFGVHSAGKKFADDVDFGKLVFRTVGYSGAEIRNLVNEAAIMSVRKGHSLITQQDIVDVLDKQLLEGMGVLLTEEEQQKCAESVSLETKRLLAVHEAGHILLAHLFPRYDWHAFSQLLPGGKETAISVFNPTEDMVNQGYTTFGYMKMQMVVAHGGCCAERVVFGDDITDGGREDLERISMIGREMVISPNNRRLGLTKLVKRVGMMDRPDNPYGEIIKYRWEDSRVIPAEMTVEVSELFTRELTRYIEETEELAMNGLQQNRHILDMIARELLEKSRLTGLEVDEKIKELSPVMFEDFVEPFQINLEEEGSLPVNDRLSYQPLDIYPAPLHRS